MKKIGIFCVGTGGHVLPAKNLILELNDKGVNLENFFVVTDERGSEYLKGLDIKIYGNRWHLDKNYFFMKSNIFLGHVDHPKYAKIIQCSKMSIILPSKENFDGITRRSFEIAAIGTFLLAKRSHEHKKYFEEDIEAVYFTNENDCYKKCLYYLKNDKLRKKIAKNGHIKVTKILQADFETTIEKFIKQINFRK